MSNEELVKRLGYLRSALPWTGAEGKSLALAQDLDVAMADAIAALRAQPEQIAAAVRAEPTQDEVEAASKSVVAEWGAMNRELAGVRGKTVGDTAREFVSPGNYRLVRACLRGYLAAIRARHIEEKKG